MGRVDPVEKIAAAAAEAVSSGVGYAYELAPGDTPIEKVFCLALDVTARFVRPYHRAEVHICKGVEDLCEGRMYDFVVIPQASIGKYRVDFLIAVWDPLDAEWADASTVKYDPDLWKFLVVECDGHDFHERTKEQAARDRRRDREMSLAGYRVFRFTGSELWRDPIKCATDVVLWSERL